MYKENFLSISYKTTEEKYENYYSYFFRWENWNTESLRNLSKDTKLINGGDEINAQEVPF